MMSDPSQVISTTGDLRVPLESTPCPFTIGTFPRFGVKAAHLGCAARLAALLSRTLDNVSRTRAGSSSSVPSRMSEHSPSQTAWNREVPNEEVVDTVRHSRQCDQ